MAFALPGLVVASASGQTWTGSAKVQTGLGYKDNLLLSHAGAVGSGFARGGVELFGWHLPQQPDGRTDYFGYFKADGTRYFSTAAVDHEADAYAVAEWRYRIGEVFKFTLDAKGFYRDEVFDVSDTDLLRSVAQLKVVGAKVGPTIHWAPRPWWWIEGEVTGKRESYDDGLNNGGVAESVLQLGWKPSSRFKASVSGSTRQRKFDRREQYSVSGRPLTGTLLRISEREGEARGDVTWDQAAHWKTVTRVSVLHYTDNDSGYFNYHQRKARQSVEWTSGAWFASLEGSARRVEFEVQTVGIGISPPTRMKEEFTAELRVERKLSDRWTLFGEFTWERSRCNDLVASYRMNEGLLGATWSWEK